MHQRAFVFTCYDPLKRTRFINGKNLNRWFLVAAKRKRGSVHNFETAHNDLIETDAAIKFGRSVFVWVGTVNTIDFGGLKNNFNAHFGAPQGGGSVGGEKRVTCAGCKNNHLAFFEIAQSLRAYIRLDNLIDTQSRLHAGV